MNPFRLTTRLAAPREVAPFHAFRPLPEEAADAPAVQVPWRVVRRSASGLEVVNAGPMPLRAARFSLAGNGLLGLSLPRTVYPDERLRVALRGVDIDGVRAAPDAILTLRWFQPDGTELLWPIAL